MGLAKGKIKQYNNFDLLFITIRAHLKFKTNELVFGYFEIIDKSILYFKAVNRSIAMICPQSHTLVPPFFPRIPKVLPPFTANAMISRTVITNYVSYANIMATFGP